MNPLRTVVATNGYVAKLNCGHAVVHAHDKLPQKGAQKFCVQCGKSKKTLSVA